MKYFLNIICFCFTCFASNGQVKSVNLVFYNKSWNPLERIDSALYFGQLDKVNDTCFICRYYYKSGPMINFETYRDSGLQVAHGLFAWYNPNGELDSVGTMNNGKRNDYWIFGYDEKYHPKMTNKYKQGVLLEHIDYTTAGGSQKLVNVAENPELNSYSPATFPGGMNKWVRFLNTNIKVPETTGRIINGISKGTVILSIEINNRGEINDVVPLRSLDWWSDMEAIRVIKKSPSWNPAVQNGKKVGYYHIQKINFASLP